MKKLLLLLFIIVFKQSIAIEKVYYESTGALKEKGMNILFDNGYHVLAGTVLTSSGLKITIKKVDYDGNIQWSQVYSLQGNNYDTRCLAIDHNLDNDGYVITGLVDLNTSISEENRVFIANINSTNGILTWSKIFDLEDAIGLDIKKTQDNGYVIGGFISTDSLGVFTSKSGLLIKTDNNGISIWTKVFTSANGFNTPDYDMIESVFPFKDNLNNQKYYVTGSRNKSSLWIYGINLSRNITSQYVLSALLDANGILIWDNSFSFNPTDCASNTPNSSYNYQMTVGADCNVLVEKGKIILLINSTFIEGAEICVLDINTGAVINTYVLRESSAQMNLHGFYFNNFYYSNDTLYIYGTANNIYCSTPYNFNNELFSPFELVVTTNDNFNNINTVSTKIFRLRNVEYQHEENDILGNKHSFLYNISACNSFKNPFIYTPKIGINKGPLSPTMPGVVLDFPSQASTIYYFDNWTLGLVGLNSDYVNTPGQETYLNGKNYHPCHLLKLNNPSINYDYNPETISNTWGNIFINQINGIEFNTTYTYNVDECEDIVAFMNCSMKRSIYSKNEEINDYQKLSIYPIPTNKLLNIFIGDFDLNCNYYVTIKNIEGKEILKFNIDNINNVKDLSSLSNGLYFVSVFKNNVNFHNQKIVINK